MTFAFPTIDGNLSEMAYFHWSQTHDLIPFSKPFINSNFPLISHKFRSQPTSRGPNHFTYGPTRAIYELPIESRLNSAAKKHFIPEFKKKFIHSSDWPSVWLKKKMKKEALFYFIFFSYGHATLKEVLSVRWSVGNDRVMKTRISAPAHLSATGGRVSGLVKYFKVF